MPFYKTTFFFEGVQTTDGTGASSAVGWTETWYQDAGDVDAALVFAMEKANYIDRRLSFLANTYRLLWVRVSNAENPRETKTGNVRNAIGIAGQGAQVTCALLVDFAVLPISGTDHVHHRRMLIRGLPLVMMNGNVIVGSSQAFSNVLTFLNYVGRKASGTPGNPGVAGPWLIRFNNPSQAWQNITALQVDPANDRQIIISSTLGALTKGAKVNVRKVRFPLLTNRQWTLRATAIAGGPYTLERSSRRLSGDWDNTGEAQTVSYLYRAPDQYLVIGLRTRQTGRPFRLTRGRSSEGSSLL